MFCEVFSTFCVYSIIFILNRNNIAAAFGNSAHMNREDWVIVKPKISKEIIFGGDVMFIQMDKWLLVFKDEGSLHFSSNFVAEWIEADVMTKGNVPKCHYKTGIIQGLEARSHASVSICDTSLTGYFEINKRFYFFEPLNETTAEHRLFETKRKNNFPSRQRRSTQYLSADWVFNLTGDTIDIQGNESDPDIEFYHNPYPLADGADSKETDKPKTEDSKIPLEYLRNGSIGEYDEASGYFYDTAWSATVITEAHSWPGQTLPTRWLEIAVGVDHTLISFHGKNKVQEYVLALMNIVSAIYQDSSLGANIKLVIARLLFYEHRKHGIVRPGNAKKSLENVNIWNKKLHASLKHDQPRHDVAIWLTRSDIGGPSGYAPVGGVCDPKRSCALNKDEGLTSAFIIAHEMAHMLGLSHDGDKKSGNDCDDDAVEGSVMASMVSATFSKFSWSACSKREYKEKIGNWSCLSNAPLTKDEIMLNATLQTAFSMDEQCRMEFGEGYLMCRAFDIIEPCSHLWCGHKDSPMVCKTKKGPPLENTECGFGKWCVNGYCSEIPQKANRIPVVLNPQHGGWSNWSSWGPCSRTCGIGVQYKTRRCDNPKPSYGGSTCEGQTEEFQLCNKGSCKNQFVDLRAQQCRMMPKIVNITGVRTSDTWLPYESQEDDKKCKFSCVSDERKEVFVLDEDLTDGTPCSYDNEDDICIQGKCYEIGCDGNLNSTAKRDKCGVCGGDGSSCTNTNITIRKRLKREIKKVAVLPRMARHIKVDTNVTFRNTIDSPSIAFVLKNRNKKGYAVTIPNTALHSKIVEGTNFFYRKIGNNHNIWGSGPILAELVIMVITSPKQASEGIFLSSNTQYSIHKDFLLPSKRYKWIIGGWGPCSASCGRGRRQKTLGCWDNRKNKLVLRKFCSLMQKPSVEAESCNNFGCKFEWIAGEWEPCSATCGSSGVQYREMYCIPNSILQTFDEADTTLPVNIWKHMVNPRKCTGIAPSNLKACNRIPCLYYWGYSEWTECSATCGTGISSRTAYCPALQDGTCGEPPPPQRKVCTGNFTRFTNKLCKGRKLRECKEDESKYCSFNLLQRYCQLKGFRRLCCKSCASYIKKIDHNMQIVTY
ncbi:unnamed protein product [Ceutorhynchus assimilis]|uniref:Uncharacterized protein n=1 Tax=Ceutorhynchus assimilis TaxID=467358 RepID=A0A9N9MSA0_9CUCU|nr:unnamed protein product [Ceutorhynchus assimilis]